MMDTTNLIEALERLLEARRAEPTTGEVTHRELAEAREATQHAWTRFDRALGAVIDARVEAIIERRWCGPRFRPDGTEIRPDGS